MEIGSGIFAGGTIIAMVALFIATKGRWNWRKVAARGLAVAVCVSAIGWFSQWAWTRFSERPLKQSELWEVKIGDSLQDIRFKKGQPQEEKNLETGLSYSYGSKELGSTVRFKDGKVRSVALYAVQEGSRYFELQGIRFGDTSKQIINRFGDDPLITTSKDGLKRIYAFPKYQVFFGMDTDKLEIFGIYDPSYPVPFGFANEDDKK